jgi:hypothetical protein
MRAKEVFDGNNGDTTKTYYSELNAKGIHGQLATALFRAQKRSTAAKRYKGRKFSRAAYDVKNWSLSEICRICQLTNEIVWGWKYDAKTINFEWVLYVETPFGQVSFHSGERLAGPDYPSDWDGARLGRERILRFCDSVMGLEPIVYDTETAFDCAVTVVAPKIEGWNAHQEMLDMRSLYESKTGVSQ